MSPIYHFTKETAEGTTHAAVDGSGVIGMGVTKDLAVKSLNERPIYIGQAIFGLFETWDVQLEAGESKPYFLRS